VTAPDWYYCLGCTAKHVMTARTLLSESIGFGQRGNRRMADQHALMALGELREGEKQSAKWPDITRRIADVRKQVEAELAMAASPEKAKLHELDEVALRCLEKIREEGVEACPTCRVETGPRHVASHRP